MLAAKWSAALTTLVALTTGGVVGANADPPALELEPLVAEARANHPATERARRVAAAEHQVPSRAGSLPDPILVSSLSNIRIDDLDLGGHPMTGLAFGVTQSLPFPGKLDRRERVAEAVASVADRRTAAIEEDIELRVRTLYWKLHYAERAEASVAESVGVLDTLTRVVHARYGVGQGAQQDALQAQVAHSRLRAMLIERREAVTSARRDLSAAVGREPTDQLPPTRPPRPVAPLRPRAELRQAARRHNPAITVDDATVEVALHGIAEARHDRWPDFAISLGYRLRYAAPGDPSDGADMVSLTVGVSLPIWTGNKQNARVRERHHRLGAARSALDATALDVLTRLEREVDALERLDAQLELYGRELLPEADQALDASITDYQVGKVGFVSVLSNWKTALELDLERERLVAERAQRRALLRALVGARITKGH